MMGSFREDDRRTVEYFSERAARFGTDVRAVDWGSRASQGRRFEILADVGLEDGASVLDFGCGQGEFYAWLAASGRKVRYAGIDITPSMVRAAQERFPGISFEVGSVPEVTSDWDYVVASGIFYLRRHQPYEYLCATVSQLFQRCRRALAFNCLSALSGVDEDREYRESPLRVFEFCRGLTPLVGLRHDYHPGDFTMYLRRSGTA
jgi:cyclopropane fatty-acyl-phospholipid synthase-like methyltransferase